MVTISPVILERAPGRNEVGECEVFLVRHHESILGLPR